MVRTVIWPGNAPSHEDEKEREWGLHPACMHIREDGPEEVPLQLRPTHTEKPEDLAEEQSYPR